MSRLRAGGKKMEAKRKTAACLNCGESREIAARGLCFRCYRQGERADDNKFAAAGRHMPAVRREHKKLFRGFTSVMVGLADLGVQEQDVLAIRRMLEPYVAPIARFLAPPNVNKWTDLMARSQPRADWRNHEIQTSKPRLDKSISGSFAVCAKSKLWDRSETSLGRWWMLAIKIIADVRGGMEYSNLYIQSYDPSETDEYGCGKLLLTSEVLKARIFVGPTEAFAFYQQQSLTVPYRNDGKPNLPLQAFTVTFEPVAMNCTSWPRL
jgi:hypothetical protein